MEYKKIRLYVDKVHKKKDGYFTAKMLSKSVSKSGIVTRRCIFMKFEEKPQVGLKVKCDRLVTGFTDEGYEWAQVVEEA